MGPAKGSSEAGSNKCGCARIAVEFKGGWFGGEAGVMKV